MISKCVRITEGMADEMLDKCMNGPDHVTIWRRTCAQTVSIKDDRITMKTTVYKVHVLVVNSTGITATGKSRWIELKWNFKLHILTDEKSQKILVFRVTDTGDAGACRVFWIRPWTGWRTTGEPRRRTSHISRDGQHPGQRELCRDNNRVCV